jgi:hypothetical protein
MNNAAAALCINVLLCAVLPVAVVHAQTSHTGPLRIAVTDRSGAPVTDARLTVLSSEGQLMAIRNVDHDGQATLDFKQQRYSLCVASQGFITRNVQVCATQETAQLVPVILDIGNCTECVTVWQAPPDPPALTPDLAENVWVADAGGRIFLPNACMPEWAKSRAKVELLPLAIPEAPNLDNVWVPNQTVFALVTGSDHGETSFN